MNIMQLEEGGVYKTREGFMSGRVYRHQDLSPHFYAMIKGGQRRFHTDGRHYYGNPDLDLVERIDVPAQAEPTTKASILDTAKAAVADRGLNYGKPEDNFQRIARLWNGHLYNIGVLREGAPFAELQPADVAQMMALMKIARLENDPTHMDSWIDIAGYAACGGEIAGQAKKDA